MKRDTFATAFGDLNVSSEHTATWQVGAWTAAKLVLEDGKGHHSRIFGKVKPKLVNRVAVESLLLEKVQQSAKPVL